MLALPRGALRVLILHRGRRCASDHPAPLAGDELLLDDVRRGRLDRHPAPRLGRSRGTGALGSAILGLRLCFERLCLVHLRLHPARRRPTPLHAVAGSAHFALRGAAAALRRGRLRRSAVCAIFDRQGLQRHRAPGSLDGAEGPDGQEAAMFRGASVQTLDAILADEAHRVGQPRGLDRQCLRRLLQQRAQEEQPLPPRTLC
mmetsp:Transcript_67962/g.196888  ORF Transcript_67962/g.196888 Transcript_67962/m.196888 type:complete len:202 (-) Transcript_67962:1014-1619(-)